MKLRLLFSMIAFFVAVQSNAQEPRADVYPSIIAATYDIKATGPDSLTRSMALIRMDLENPVMLGCHDAQPGVEQVWEDVAIAATEDHAVVRAVAYPATNCRGPESDPSDNAARIFFRAPNPPEMTDASGGA